MRGILILCIDVTKVLCWRCLDRRDPPTVNVLDAVAKKGSGVRSIADPMIDTTSAHGKLILAVLAALAEFERSMFLARTSEGRSRAKARGAKFGRKPALNEFQREEALKRRAAGENLADIGRTFGVSHSTISRL
jgi:DNA invertase Pin-like site-specific DNA recombinase